ncbi:hypothetical protein HQ560_20190, partial [bacterium]|nr:hypothetical protein [bacterium]
MRSEMRGGMWMAVSRLPMPLKIVCYAFMGGSLLGGVFYMMRHFAYGVATWIILGGVLLVILLLVLFRAILKMREKRKGAGFGGAIEEQSAGVPQSVSAADRRAMLDDLRRNFEKGIDTFRAHGKNLYKIPWYIVMGEPGSGKTEAIRHSNIGFPPGLHDPLQGSGGTINMHWWFTDRAVILDTAGRIAFEEVQAGASSEWQEFLNLLKQYRPNCPVNGMFLVIPADTLTTDTADEISSKAHRIAERLHELQRILQVRFPVFIAIAKADKILGFREFFESLSDPRLTSQMLGWSNPSPIDEPFNPDQVDQYIATVCERLRRRRMGLLSDPIHTDDPDGRRTDQVDALYAFPTALTRIASRLQLYLSTVFAGGEWTGKPVFMRGIYFTSSMREGAALDADLATALGVPVESLPDDRAWDREQSYFLKDVFTEKAFREAGLVTRASNAQQQQHRRKTTVIAAGFAAVLILGFFTWFGIQALKQSLGVHRDYWVAAAGDWRDGEEAETADTWRPIVSKEYEGSDNFVYTGASEIEVGRATTESLPIVTFHKQLRDLAAQEIQVSWIFWLAKIGTDNLTAERRLAAQRVLYESCIVRPLFDASRDKLRQFAGGEAWPDEASHALAALIRAEAEGAAPSDLDPLFRLALARESDGEGTDGSLDSGIASYEEDRDAIDALHGWIYSDEGSGRWPAVAAAIGSEPARASVAKGLDGFLAHWRRKGEAANSALAAIVALVKTLSADYAGAEELVLKVDDEWMPRLKVSKDTEAAAIRDAMKSWQERLQALGEVRAGLEKQLAAFPDGPLAAFRASSDAVGREIAAAFESFRAEAEVEKGLAISWKPPEDGPATKPVAVAADGKLVAALGELQAITRPATLEETLKTLDLQFLMPVRVDDDLWDWIGHNELLAAFTRDRHKTKSVPLYEARLMMYELAESERRRKDDDILEEGLRAAVEGVETRVAQALVRLDKLRGVQPEGYRMKEGAGVTSFVCDALAKPGRIYFVLDERLGKAPRTEVDVAQRIVKANVPPLVRPRVPLTGMDVEIPFDKQFHPKAVQAMLDEVTQAGELLRDTDIKVIDRKKLQFKWAAWRAVCQQYINGRYYDYWSIKVVSDLEVKKIDWAVFRAALRGDQERGIAPLDADDVNINLKTVGSTISDALAVTAVTAGSAASERLKNLQEFRSALHRNLRKLDLENYHMFGPKCKGALTRWAALCAQQSGFGARNVLVSLRDQEIVSEYFAFAFASPAEIVDRYWTEVSREGIRLIVKEAHGGDIIRQLQQYDHFPLNRPGARTLTQAEVDTARALVAKLLLKQQPGGGAETGPRPSGELQKQIDQLRNLRL